MEQCSCLRLRPCDGDVVNRPGWLQPLEGERTLPGYCCDSATMSISVQCPCPANYPLGRELTVHPDGDVIGIWGIIPSAADGPELAFAINLKSCEVLERSFRLCSRSKISWSATTGSAPGSAASPALIMRISLHLPVQLFSSGDAMISDLRAVLDHCDPHGRPACSPAGQEQQVRLNTALTELLGASDATSANNNTCLIRGCTLHPPLTPLFREKFRLAEILKSLAAPEDVSAVKALASAPAAVLPAGACSVGLGESPALPIALASAGFRSFEVVELAPGRLVPSADHPRETLEECMLYERMR